MLKNILAKYLDVEWSDENTVLKVEYSNDPIEMEHIDDFCQIESCTFKKNLSRIGFKIVDEDTFHSPYFEVSELKKVELLAIKDPSTRETWWIENSGWDKKNQRYFAETFRTVGNLNVIIQNQKIKIVNNSLGFSVKELERYLADFKNDLWMLILNDQGYIKGQVEKKIPSIFAPEFVRLLHDYAGAVEKIIKKPSIELKEFQSFKPIKSVKPVKKTFLEIAVKGWPKYLTSRAFLESFDTPDNRYIHYTLKRVIYLARQISKLVASQQNIYEEKINSEEAILSSLSSNIKDIDPVVYSNELKSMKEQFQNYKNILKTIINTENKRDTVIRSLVLENNWGRTLNKFFCKEINGEDFKKKYDTYLVVEFPDDMPMEEVAPLIKYKSIEITACIREGRDKDQNGKEHGLLKIISISQVRFLDHPIEAKIVGFENKKKIYEDNGWKGEFSYRELQEIKNERNSIGTNIKLANQRKTELKKADKHLKPILKKLNLCKRFFDSNKIAVNNNFPNTMVFVQNPWYSLAKSSFSKIAKTNGIDENLFESMILIDEIGLVNISNLYEKWCLIQIITVLTEVYKFEIKGDWQKRLIDAVSQKKYNIEFKLSSGALGYSITLTYEKELNSGKRPDFVLDIHLPDQILKDHFPDKPQRRWRYVIDAKFKDNLNDTTLSDLVSNLYSDELPYGKNYSENNKNSVFILHASHSAISDRTTPLEWGYHSDYGQSHKCNHKYGGVYLSPSYKFGRSFDNLQRLIGLILQETYWFEKKSLESNAFAEDVSFYNDIPFHDGVPFHDEVPFNYGNSGEESVLPDNDVSYADIPIDKPENTGAPYLGKDKIESSHNFFCISCGNSNKDTLNVVEKTTASGNEKWNLECSNCNNFQVKSFCRSCHRTLNKNGYYWTYHRTRAEEPFNIVCPECEEFL